MGISTLTNGKIQRMLLEYKNLRENYANECKFTDKDDLEYLSSEISYLEDEIIKAYKKIGVEVPFGYDLLTGK